jgi:hypothetical protein
MLWASNITLATLSRNYSAFSNYKLRGYAQIIGNRLDTLLAMVASQETRINGEER